MQLRFTCPACQHPVATVIRAGDDAVSCGCGWRRPIADSPSAAESEAAAPTGPVQKCLVCGCHDLWRQKDFPQGLGLLMVGLGALLSTIAWFNYLPELALGILLVFALIDILLYTVMRDVLVCYRCKARYADTPLDEHARFNLETAERYRQEAARVEGARTTGKQ